jgi:hypothetical protein
MGTCPPWKSTGPSMGHVVMVIVHIAFKTMWLCDKQRISRSDKALVQVLIHQLQSQVLAWWGLH